NLSLTGTSDPSSADTSAGFTYAFDCGSGYGPFGSSNSATCQASDGGSVTVRGKVRDKDGGVTEYSSAASILNVAPDNIALNLNSGSVQEGSSVILTGSFTDPGTLDTHTVVVNWGPGEASDTINLAAGVLTFTTSHTYRDDNPTGTSSDSYPIGVTVTDKDG